MCGRFAFAIPRTQVIRRLQEDYPDLDLDDEWADAEDFHPRYNIAPRTRSVVIRQRYAGEDRDRDKNAEASANDSTEAAPADKSVSLSSKARKANMLHTMKWGLVPHWSKHEDTSLNTINAKGENLVDGGGMWGSLKGRKRCVVACQGYYEWLKKGKDKVPHFTKHKDGKVMLLAGLYDSVVLEGTSEPLWTFTIVTTDANKQLSWLHDRMPLVLSTPAQLSAWLDTSTPEWTPKLAKLVRPYSVPPSRAEGKKGEQGLECYPVPGEVGKVGMESATFIEPVSKRKDGIEAMFSRQKKKEVKSDEERERIHREEKNEEKKKGGPLGKKRTRDESNNAVDDRQKRHRSSSVEILEGPPSKRPK